MVSFSELGCRLGRKMKGPENTQIMGIEGAPQTQFVLNLNQKNKNVNVFPTFSFCTILGGFSLGRKLVDLQKNIH